MKIIFAILLTSVVCVSASAQDEAITSNNKHEIGVDAAPFLSQFLGLGSSGFWTSNYSLMYRYHFEKIAIRARVGGSLNSSDDSTNDSIKNKSENGRVFGRLGIEYKVDFKKRWQFFYGIDLMAGSQTYLTHYRYTSYDSWKDKTHTQTYGAAPLIGFRFKINDRISISTESSFAFNYSKSHHERLYTPDYQYNRVTDAKGFNTDFYPPIFLFFHYNF